MSVKTELGSLIAVTENFHNFDKIIEEIGIGKFHHLLLLTCGLCLMTTITETLNIGFAVPLIESESSIRLSLSQKGVLDSAAFMGIVITSIFWGFFADVSYGGRKKVMHLSTIFTFFFSVASSFSLNFIMLAVSRFFVGFFVSGVAANTFAYLGEFHCNKNRSKQITLVGFFMTAAIIFVPGIAWLLVKNPQIVFTIPFINLHFPIWRIFLLSCSSLSGIISILLIFLPESPKFLLSHDRHFEAVEVLKKICKWNKKSSLELSIENVYLDEVNASDEGKKPFFLRQIFNQIQPLFKSPLLVDTLKAIFVVVAIFATSAGFFMWTPDILNQLQVFRNESHTVCEVVHKVMKLKLTKSKEVDAIRKVDETIYEITFLMGVCISFLNIFNGLVINYIGKINLLAILLFLCGLSGVFVPWTSDYKLIIFLMLVFITCGICFALLSAIIVDIFPTNVKAITMAVVSMIGRIGTVGGSNLVSLMVMTQCEAMFGVFGGLLMASAVVTLFFRKGN